MRQFLAITLLLWSAFAQAQPLKVESLGNGIYALVGDLGNRSPENFGNNATFGVVVTQAGIVLIDSGGSYRGAEQIAQTLRSISDQPVVRVINSGGQDHRWFGNGYFRQQGARIIASEAAVVDHKARFQDQWRRLKDLVGAEGVAATEPVYADETFTHENRFELGGVKFELYHKGAAHTPGDSLVWLPDFGVLFSGDIVYTERMLGVGPQSNSRSWVEVLQQLAAFEPLQLVPGHGSATTLERAMRESYDYLTLLRRGVAQLLEAGGDIGEITTIDQSSFRNLRNFDLLSGRNAQQVYIEMEWE
ncbi:MAG: MBL fold metallo-hydrolase [Gammaproteobacteria bacterium]|nr:MBL fold metallo-hydrolase [Gammaproteobacteria bacterium]